MNFSKILVFVCVIALVVILLQSCIKQSNNNKQKDLPVVNSKQEYFSNLKECTRARFLDNDGFYEIYGIKGNKCHFKNITIECNMPLDKTDEFATAILNKREDTKEAQIKMMKQYCIINLGIFKFNPNK